MSLESALEQSSLSLVVLVEITATKWCRAWVPHASYADVGQIEIAEEVTSVTFDGTALTEVSDVATVEATADSWTWAAGFLYVQKSGGASTVFGNLFTGTIVASCLLRCSNKSKVLSGVPYEPRLVSAPAVSARVPETFSGVGQIGGGDLVLSNADARFDGLVDWDLDGGRVVLKVGADLGSVEMAAGDYQTLATWLIESWQADNAEFRLRLREIKGRSERKLPSALFTRATYPNIPEDGVGEVIPLAYGRVRSVAPRCVDVGAKRFKVAGHAIYSLDRIWILSDDVWRPSSFATTDLSNAEFTLGADWTGTEDIALDFTGRKNGDGTPMLNAVDIIEDLLAQVGETDVDATTLATARARLVLGSDEDGRELCLRCPSIYLDASEDLFSVLEQVCRDVGATIYIGADGTYRVNVWEPVRSEGALTIDTLDVFGITDETESDPASLVRLSYGERVVEDYRQTVEASNSAFRYRAGLTGDRIIERDGSMLTELADARYVTQRTLEMEGGRRRMWSVETTWKAWLLTPGDVVRLVHDRLGIDTVAEVFEVRHNLGAGRVTLRLGDQRTFSGRSGFWVSDSAVLPTRFSTLAGYGSGALAWNAAWDPEIKRWAKENVGYWTDENGFADPDDPDSFIPSCWV